MGNVFESERKDNHEHSGVQYLTSDEQACLRQLHKALYDEGNSARDAVNIPQLGVLFALDTKSTVRKNLVPHFLSHIKNYSEFEAFVVRSTRMTTSDTLSSFWGILNSTDHENLNDFWAMVVETSRNTEAGSDTAVVSRLCEFVATVATVCGVQLTNGEGHISLTALASILNNYLPHTVKSLESYVSTACLRGVLSPSYKPFLAPQLDIPSEIASVADLLPLALHSEALQGKWKRLYSTSVDGCSFNRVEYSCLGYEGPTFFLIKCQDEEGTVLGALAHERWKDSNRFYGSSKDALFVISPKLRIYRGKGVSNGAYQWLNTKSHSLPRGLGFGGTSEGFRLFVPESMEGCVAANSCPTFEAGKLIETERFEIHTLEVWGCGGSEAVAAALLAQQNERALVDENIRKARQVDKAQFFNNEFDREFFLSGSSSHHGNDRSGNA